MNYQRLRGFGPVPSFAAVPKDNLLIVGDSERNSDMLYAVRAFVPEQFIWFTRKAIASVVVHDGEFDRVREEVRHCRVLSYSKFERRLERENAGEPVGFHDVLVAVLRAHRLRKVTVPDSFPLGLARALRAKGVKVKLRGGPFFPDRAWKTADEIKKISAALVMAEVGMAEGLHALKRAKAAKNRRLMLNQAPLTAERLRGIIDSAILQAGGQANHTIVACGRQASDPHERGYGPLHANEPIVIDIIPRSQRTGYFGDVTRTVVCGRPTEFVRGMFAAVLESQRSALQTARCGTATVDVHRAAEAVFKRHGFRTCRRPGHMAGFFRPTGHGIGLDIHEPPRLSARSRETLRAGHVVAVEPGLYFPEIGGVRLEDVILVTRGGARVLTKVEQELEI